MDIFGPWGRDRSQSPPCWIFRVKHIHQSTASERTTWLTIYQISSDYSPSPSPLSVYPNRLKVQVFGLISSLKTYHPTWHFTPLVTGPVHLCAISTPRRAYSPAVISAHSTYHTHCHLCTTRYSFSPESSEAFEGEVPCTRTQHRNNIPRLRGEKHIFLWKSFNKRDSKPHGRQRHRQSVTL